MLYMRATTLSAAVSGLLILPNTFMTVAAGFHERAQHDLATAKTPEF